MKHLLTLVALLFFISLHAQVYTEISFNKDSKNAESTNVALFRQYISNKKSLKLTTVISKKVPRVIYKEGLEVYLIAKIKKENGRKVYESKPIKRRISTGESFLSGDLFFSKKIFSELPSGNYKIDFDIKPVNIEYYGVLRKRPARIPLTFTIK